MSAKFEAVRNSYLTAYALSHVLEHLGEDQQSPKPEHYTSSEAFLSAWHAYQEHFVSRAAARVIVKRVLRAAESEIALLWYGAKEAGQ